MTDITTDSALNVTSAATRTALATVRLLTQNDPRVPALFPDSAHEMHAIIAGLEDIAADHAARCYQHNPNVPARERAFATLVYTRSATEIVRAATSWAMGATGDHNPLHAAAEAALLATLAWQLLSGRSVAWLGEAARACAVNVAGELAREAGRWFDQETLRDQHRAAEVAAAGAGHLPQNRIDHDSAPIQWGARAEIANRSARFIPIDSNDTDEDGEPQLPCVEVAGVQTYVYMDTTSGKLKVSLHLDGAEGWLLDGEGNVPVEVNIGGDTVFEG